MEKLRFISDDGEMIDLYPVEQTKLGGVNYLLLTDSADENDEEAEYYIMKDLSPEDAAEAEYDFVEDEEELDTVMELFSKLLDGVDFSVEE